MTREEVDMEEFADYYASRTGMQLPVVVSTFEYNLWLEDFLKYKQDKRTAQDALAKSLNQSEHE